jgi:ATP-dependent DNA helicase RecQ
MMKVLIVAKTRQGSAACIGGITFEGRSVRLIAADAATNEHAGMEYQIGDVWEVEAVRPPRMTPPHVENIVVRSKRRLGPMTDPCAFIEKHMPPKQGTPAILFEGLARSSASGALYIAEHTGIPPYSTTFWRPDRPLTRVEEGKRLRYRYASPDNGHTLVFVGFQEPVAVIPAGTLLRVSLAHWWCPTGDANIEPRCYVQLSGWYLSEEPVTQGSYRATPQDEPMRCSAQGASTASDAAPAALTSPLDILKSVFGYESFRPLQAEIIANMLAGRSSLAVMPTGSGKSICYQLPALVLDGLTVVVSPLISLMQDQVMQLRDLGLPAAFLNSTVEYDSYRATAAQVRTGAIKLLYTSPETLLRPETLVLLDQSHVRCLAIDEAHCISQWGHDFRPEYRQLLPVHRRYPQAPCIALTATATPRVQSDIQDVLGIRPEDTFIASFDRPNLFLAARPRANGLAQVLSFVQDHRDQPGIIYCSTRDGVERLTAFLAANGVVALPYHAGMDNGTRCQNQELFSRDRAPVIVATIAFGMGINKSNVRYVLHYNLPKDLESYYQEIGRAGRDGLRADCLLLYSRADLFTIRKFIDEGAEGERQGRRARLNAMLDYAEAQGCRRKVLLGYFSEATAVGRCDFCDVCASYQAIEGAPTVDVSADARLLLDAIRTTGEMFGPAYIADLLRGSRSGKVVERQHDRLPQHGSGRHHPAGFWRDLIDRLVRRGVLARDAKYGSLRLTEAARRVLAGAELSLPAEPAEAVPVAEAEYDVALFERLRVLRRELADAANVPPYVVFSDRSLAEMATHYPQTPQRLLDIQGVGQRKLEAYGERFLEVIRAYCSEHGLVERSRPTALLPQVQNKGTLRWQQVGSAFADGAAMEQLIAQYDIKESTVVQHLSRYVWAGGKLDAARIRALSKLSEQQQEQVLAVMAELGLERLTPVFAALDGAISYEELHLMRLYLLCTASIESSRERP